MWATGSASENNTANGPVAKITFKVLAGKTVTGTSVKIEHVEARTQAGQKVNFADATVTRKLIPGESGTTPVVNPETGIVDMSAYAILVTVCMAAIVAAMIIKRRKEDY